MAKGAARDARFCQRGIRRFGTLGMSALVFVLCLMTGVRVAVCQSREYQVKAAFLYNFTKFVEWPEGSFKDRQSPLTICIFGKDPFGDALDALKDKMVEGRKIEVKRAARVDEIERCHMLFICPAERDALSQVLKAVSNLSVLTVGDTKGFAESGVILNLTMADDKVTFEINLQAAEKTSLKISSKLLKLARIVK